MSAAFLRLLRALPLLLLSPLLVGLPLLALALTDLLWLLFAARRSASPSTPAAATGSIPVWTQPESASVVIPNWNGKDLLEKYLPSVTEALAGHPDNEVIVVDNGSTDGSAAFLRSHFPQVRLLALERNQGFGGGSNAGFRAARNQIVVLLNSDMRVAPGFLPHLLAGFTSQHVFAVSCQIFFSDPSKKREETGLTQASWQGGRLRVRHRLDDAIQELFPCFYGGGGSCAFHRGKFLELGGFDSLLAPFYLEDTDLGYMAWKRGWQVFYQPKSVVFHEHRGTIGRTFSPAYIGEILKKNFLLFTWKNLHDWRTLGAHFASGYADALLSVVFGDSPERASLQGFWRALRQLPQVLGARWRAKMLARIGDREAMRRPLGGYFRDRFVSPGQPETETLNVLFVSPYPICPPIHGGGVFMYQTTMELAQRCRLHLIALLDAPHERQAHQVLIDRCRSAEFLVRISGAKHTLASIAPHAISEFANADLDWLIHRQLYLHRIDVLQLEYLPMAQYAGSYRRLLTVLFEHDIYFQSIGRQLEHMKGAFTRLRASVEYLRALRYELRTLPHVDRIQTCSADNAQFLLSYAPRLSGRIDPDLRAGIDTGSYRFQPVDREPNTLLFLGSFRHLPNQEAVDWMVRLVMPLVLEAQPHTRLVLVGSDPPPRHAFPDLGGAVEFRGFVPDVNEPLARYALFVCPILSGSGVRVKLLEAFASGIPVVSTYLGAEGLATVDGEICALAATPGDFALRTLHLLHHPSEAEEMARRARQYVEKERDIPGMTARLERGYRQALSHKRANS